MKRILHCKSSAECPTSNNTLCKRCKKCLDNESGFTTEEKCNKCEHRCPACLGTCSQCHLPCDDRQEDFYNPSRFV